jgi:hypothetical protein
MSNTGSLFSAGYTPVDVQAPGAGIIGLSQVGNKTLRATITLPTTDSDGSELTGLAKCVIGIALADGNGENPFIDVASFASVAVKIEEIAVTPETGLIEVDLPVLSVGAIHFVAAYCQD